MNQKKLSKEEVDLLKKIEDEGRYTIRKKNEKNLSFNLDGSGLISLEKNTKATYVINDKGRAQLENLLHKKLDSSSKAIVTPSTDLNIINQKIDDLKKSIQDYQKDLKHYIEQQLTKQNEIILKLLEDQEKETIDESAFLEFTREEYVKLAKTSPMSPYVSIKLLRDFVCKRLDLDKTNFDVMLLSIATKDPYTVQLSTGSGEGGAGIIYGRSECHAAIIK